MLFSLAAARCTGIASAFWVVTQLLAVAVEQLFAVVVEQLFAVVVEQLFAVVVEQLFAVVVDAVFMAVAGPVPARHCWHKRWVSTWKLTDFQSSAYSPLRMIFNREVLPPMTSPLDVSL